MSARYRRARNSVDPRQDSASAAPLQRDYTRLCLPLLLIWIAAVHANGLSGAFVFDDKALTENQGLQNFADFGWFRLTNRPVTMGTFALNFSLFGVDPLSCHVTNLVIHLAVAACVFLLIRRTLTRWDPSLQDSAACVIAFAVTLLWGVHPLGTGAVTYLVQRAESLATLGIVGCLLAWSHAFGQTNVNENAGGDDATRPTNGSRQLVWAMTAIVSAYLAYGSKQMSAGLPLIVLLYDRVFLARAWQPIRTRAGWYVSLALPLVLGAILIAPGLFADSGGRRTIGFDVNGVTPWSYFTSQPRVFLEYVRLSFLPLQQSLDYGWIPSRKALPQWIGLLAWVGIAATTTMLWRRSKELGFLIMTSFLVLAPTSTLIPIQDMIFEHRFYLPLTCLIAAVVLVLATRGGVIRQRSTMFVCVPLAAILSVLTVNRNFDYTSAERIHFVDTRHRPDNPRAWYSLATTARFGRPGPKIEMLAHAIALSDRRDFFYAGAEYKWPRDLADTLFLSGNVAASRPIYERALQHCHDELQETEIHFRLAMIASMEGSLDEAETLFRQALTGHKKLRPQIEEVYAAHRRRHGHPERRNADNQGGD